nr:hypothetical protein [Sphingobacterium sp.]
MSIHMNMPSIAIIILHQMSMQTISMMIVHTVFYIIINSSRNLLRIHGKVILENSRKR